MQKIQIKKIDIQSYQNKKTEKIDLTTAKTQNNIATSIIVKIKKKNKKIK